MIILTKKQYRQLLNHNDECLIIGRLCSDNIEFIWSNEAYQRLDKLDSEIFSQEKIKEIVDLCSEHCTRKTKLPFIISKEFPNAFFSTFSSGTEFAISFPINITEPQSCSLELARRTIVSHDYNFLSNISHEIRTPLNGIVGTVSLLQDSSLTTEQQEYVETLRQSSFNLMAIINDILDVTKLELHKINLISENFYIRECIESSFDIIASAASEKRLHYSYYIEDTVPEYVKGDFQRLRQVLVNLLSNAVKFTKKGAIKLTLEAMELDENDQYELKFHVMDTGIGISKEDQTKLFKAFSQIDTGADREYQGIGIGLVICKELVELYGGKITLDSDTDMGSTFHFNIFVNKVENKNASRTPDVDYNNLANRKILVVDDKEENRKYLQLILFKWGMTPYLFASGEEALNFLKYSNVQFDLGLLDICMPRMSGYDLAKKLPATFPLIALSSFGDKIQETNSDFIDHISKPIHQDRLLKLIHHSVRKHHSPLVRSTVKRTPRKIHDGVQILVAEDIYLNQKVIKKMLEKLGFRNVDVVENGLQVMESIKTKKYNLIFMDLRMPLLDGVSASKKISKMYGKDRPKIVALTAMAFKNDIEKNMSDCYIDSFLIKPIDLDILEKLLEKFFS